MNDGAFSSVSAKCFPIFSSRLLTGAYLLFGAEQVARSHVWELISWKMLPTAAEKAAMRSESSRESRAANSGDNSLFILSFDLLLE